MAKDPTPAKRLAGFLVPYTPEIAKLARAALKKLRTRLPGAVELVYDNYNALVIAFGPTEIPSDIVLSIALYPRWISLFFLHGSSLPDPEKRLKGAGKIRHVRLESAATLDEPAVSALISAATARAKTLIDGARRGRIVIKSVSPKQRPRRPA